jgi:hypothetical protein
MDLENLPAGALYNYLSSMIIWVSPFSLVMGSVLLW